MSVVFLKLLNLSITASWLILAVILVRFLLKKAPKWISCVLWALVAIRLICPFSLESALSLIPSSETIPSNIEMMQKPAIDSGITAINEAVNPAITHSFAPDPMTSANPLQIVIPVLSIVWIVGMAAMLLYALISYIRLKKSVGASVPVRDNILACDEVKSPFILGIIKPLIYVPSSMEGETLDYVITHESAHIQRRDHWWKPFGFLLLAVYWFNPLCWLAYVLLCRDIEMACDEKVIRELDNNDKAAYSQALLNCSFPRRRIAACPLAFGEVGVKERVKSVLNYKKPAFWIIVVAVVACIVVAVCFGTNPTGTILTKWDTDTVDMNKVLDDVRSLSVQYWNTSVDCNDSETNRFLATMGKIKVGRKPISISRDEGRSAVFIITINEHLKLNFNESFDEIWVDNGVKPSYTYKITNPSTAEELLLDFSFTAYGDSTKWDCSVICAEASTPDHYVINYSDVKVSSQTGTLTFQNRNDFDIVVHILREGETEVVSDQIPAGGCYSLLKVNDKPCTIGVHADVDVNTEIKLFVYDGNWSETYSMIEHHATKWFDCLHGDEMVWDGMREINLDEFPGVTFRASYCSIEAVTDKETIPLYTGMPIWSVFFCDLNGDGKPELCSSTSFGSGLIDNRFIIYDYANGASYERSDRGQYDYTLNLQNGKLIVEKRGCMQEELAASGELVFRDETYQIIWDKSIEPCAVYLTDYPENEFTARIPKPANGTIDYVIDDSANGRYAVFFKDITMEQSEAYIKDLKAAGYTNAAGKKEDIAIGEMLQKDDVTLSVACSDGGLGIQIIIEDIETFMGTVSVVGGVDGPDAVDIAVDFKTNEAYYSLSDQGNLTVSGLIGNDHSYIQSQTLWTNSTQISIKNNSGTDVTAYLFSTADESSPILEMTLSNKEKKAFKYLSSQYAYYVRISADSSANVSVDISD